MKKWLLTMSLLAPVIASAQTDVTSYIKNPSFEQGTRYWKHKNIVVQDNTSFGPKKGSIYLERWVDSGTNVGTVSVEQTLGNISPGVYTLTAGAQCIKQSQMETAMRGATLFASDKSTPVTASGEYSVMFTVLDPVVTVGFNVKSTGANWVAVDNFRLARIDNSPEVLAEELQQRIDAAKELSQKAMADDALASLTAAIATAEEEMQNVTTSTVAKVAAALRQAVTAATKSVRDAEITALIESQATGSTPRVTMKNYARGTSVILVRATIQPTTTKYKGLCYATHPEPTYMDDCTDELVTGKTDVFIARDLKPGTMYYVRPYGVSSRGKYAYGEEIKVATLPKGNVTYSYDNGGSAIQNARIWSALDDAAYYYNTYTSINGYSTSCHFGSGTPTADCSYGGWMRVGPNESYQRTGTIMHEMSHGVGVGTHGVWNDWGTPMRADHGSGAWLGERTSAILGFIDDAKSGTLWGDNQHMWPYGINGSWEDTGEEWLYIANAMIVQAVCEDALPPTNGFSLPYYAFDCQEGMKYYLKNSKSDFGRESAFLTMDSRGYLTWQEMSTDQAVANDSAAWYIDFHPSVHYYTVRNAATGRYIAYRRQGTNGFATQIINTASVAKAYLQLMSGRIDVKLTNGSIAPVRGFYLTQPEATLNPPTLSPTSKNQVAAENFNLQDEGGRHQRWMILTADQARTVNAAYDATVGLSPIPSDTETTAAPIYTIDGKRVTSTSHPGVYIINGHKVVK